MIKIPTKFENFTEKLMEAPFVRIAIFAVICGIACIKYNDISSIAFGVVANALITRLISAMIFNLSNTF